MTLIAGKHALFTSASVLKQTSSYYYDTKEVVNKLTSKVTLHQRCIFNQIPVVDVVVSGHIISP